MMRAILLALFAVPALAQPVLQTQWVDGVERAVVLHASSGDAVSDAEPAAPGETLIASGSGMAGDLAVLAGEETVNAACLDDGHVQFTLPSDASGAFFEISLLSDAGRSNAATVPVAASDPSQLSAADVDGITQRAAAAIDDPHMAIAVVDRAGRPLAIYRKPLATDDDVETALSLARTGAFFSHNQAPLSSRTVRTISREHFPNDIPNQPAAPLFGIENTNRGCGFNTAFLPGQSVPPARSADGTATGKGIATVPGGIPLFKNGPEVGGLGVAGIDPDAAEFAAVAATFGTPFFVTLPLPPPGAVFIDGVRLPYVNQTTRPAGAQAVSGDPGGFYQIAPRDGAAAPDGYLVGPNAGSALSAADVNGIIQRAIDRANRTRAIIRLPLGSRAKFAIAVTDLDGTLLGLYRMADATIFSTDVSVAKARNVVYFSGNPDPSDLPGVPAGTAVTNRTIGFGAQSLFPSGISDSTPGPFRDLYLYDLANPCTQGHQPPNSNQNGVVFFPGSAPLYRSGQLVGGLGVSGDGVDQDDYVTAAGAQGFEPPDSIRADQVFLRGVRLPYFKFPRNPEQ